MIRTFLKDMFSFQKSIQAKIFIAFASVTMVSLVAVSTVLYMNAANTIKSNVTAYSTGSMKNSNQNLETVLKETNDMIASVLLNEDIVKEVFFSNHYPISFEWFQEMKRVESFLASIIANKSNVKRIMIAGPGGKLYKAGSQRVGSSVMEQPWVGRIEEGLGERVFINRNLEDTDREDVITVGRAVVLGGKIVGIISVDIKYDIIREVFDLGASDESIIMVVDGAGEFIYCSDPEIKERNITATPWDTVFRNRSVSRQQREITVHGVTYLSVYYSSGYSGWTTIGLIPEAALVRQSMILREQVTLIALLVFVLLLLVSMAVSGRITRNTKRLCDTMKNVTEDNLDVEITISSQDEIGQLEGRFISMMARIKNLLEDIKKREAQKRITELKVLQAQISPHFLYNTLNTIGHLARLQNIPNIEEVTVSLINLLRVVSRETDELITIRQELQYIDSYVRIQKYKNINPFSVLYQVEDEILDCKTLKLLLQPIVENAVIHGIENVEHEGIISIKIFRENSRIKITVTDNGVGMTPEQIEAAFKDGTNMDKQRFSGIGIGNVNERIKLFFGNAYGLEIFSRPRLFTTVEMSIPRIEEKEGCHV